MVSEQVTMLSAQGTELQVDHQGQVMRDPASEGFPIHRWACLREHPEQQRLRRAESWNGSW